MSRARRCTRGNANVSKFYRLRQEWERAVLELALKRFPTVKETAKYLDLNRAHLHKMMSRLGIESHRRHNGSWGVSS